MSKRVEKIEKRLAEARDFLPLDYTVTRRESLFGREGIYTHEFRDANGYHVKLSGEWEGLKDDPLSDLLAKAPGDLKYLLNQLKRAQKRIRELENRPSEAIQKRVVINRDAWGNRHTKVDGRDVAVNYSYGRVYLIDHEEKNLDANTSEDFERLSLAFAAMATEKREEEAREASMGLHELLDSMEEKLDRQSDQQSKDAEMPTELDQFLEDLPF